jgi:ABC-type transport system involved in Fe-S cluster assembly fused permease/ATPase subunit
MERVTLELSMPADFRPETLASNARVRATQSCPEPYDVRVSMTYGNLNPEQLLPSARGELSQVLPQVDERRLAGRPALLLLDDCTAALDADTEDRFWQALRETGPGCTIVCVTHRINVLARANRIAVLHCGTVVEAGTLTELNRPGTRFRELYVEWQLMEQMRETAPSRS